MPVRMAAVIPNEGGATKHWCFEIILLKKFAQSNEPPIYNDAFHLHQVVYSEKIQSILVCLFISSGCNIISAWDIDSYSVVNWLFQMLCAVCFNIFISILQSLSTTVSIIVESWKLKKNDFLQNPVKNLFSLTERKLHFKGTSKIWWNFRAKRIFVATQWILVHRAHRNRAITRASCLTRRKFMLKEKGWKTLAGEKYRFYF